MDLWFSQNYFSLGCEINHSNYLADTISGIRGIRWMYSFYCILHRLIWLSRSAMFELGLLWFYMNSVWKGIKFNVKSDVFFLIFFETGTLQIQKKRTLWLCVFSYSFIFAVEALYNWIRAARTLKKCQITRGTNISTGERFIMSL